MDLDHTCLTATQRQRICQRLPLAISLTCHTLTHSATWANCRPLQELEVAYNDPSGIQTLRFLDPPAGQWLPPALRHLRLAGGAVLLPSTAGQRGQPRLRPLQFGGLEATLQSLVLVAVSCRLPGCVRMRRDLRFLVQASSACQAGCATAHTSVPACLANLPGWLLPTGWCMQGVRPANQSSLNWTN